MLCTQDCLFVIFSTTCVPNLPICLCHPPESEDDTHCTTVNTYVHNRVCVHYVHNTGESDLNLYAFATAFLSLYYIALQTIIHTNTQTQEYSTPDPPGQCCVSGLPVEMPSNLQKSRQKETPLAVTQ